MKIIKICIVSFISCICTIVSAQDSSYLPKLNPPLPEVYSLFKFSEIPVSNTTGVPNITIPIHNINIKNVQFPITLNYNSSGIRINEIASCVGLGWNLNSSGMIYKQTNGLDDDESAVMINMIPNNREIEMVNGLGARTEDYYMVKNYLTAPNHDTQRDIYSFSCGNLTGKFFIDSNDNIWPVQYLPIKIVKEGPVKFVITDNNGTKYTFNRKSEKQTNTTIITRPSYTISNQTTKDYIFYIEVV